MIHAGEAVSLCSNDDLHRKGQILGSQDREAAIPFPLQANIGPKTPCRPQWGLSCPGEDSHGRGGYSLHVLPCQGSTSPGEASRGREEWTAGLPRADQALGDFSYKPYSPLSWLISSGLVNFWHGSSTCKLCPPPSKSVLPRTGQVLPWP